MDTNDGYNNLSAGDVLLDEKQVARLLGVTRRCLQNWRLKGIGLPYVFLSRRCVRYRKEDVQNWLASRRVNSTTEAGVLEV